MASLLLLTGCGTPTKARRQSLESTGQAYAQITKGGSRADARARLGPPQSVQKREDIWELKVDEDNGERLELKYDRKNLITDGNRSSWRGNQKGLFRWHRRFTYYLPEKSQNPPLTPLKSRSFRKQIRL